MTGEERPLPSPPRARFGDGDPAAPTAPLTADRMAQAAAEGRLEDFLQREIPGGEHARSLAMMMMGMSGMAPPLAPPVSRTPPSGHPAPDAAVPPELLAAAGRGDVAGLASLLQAEHARRAGECPETAAAAPAAGRAGIDAAVVEELLRIAAANDVSVDWLLFRAVKLYVEEHRKTGRL